MKSQGMEQVRQETESPPSRGAWTESPPSRGAWIEIADTFRLLAKSHTSPPSRGAWIEIPREVSRAAI